MNREVIIIKCSSYKEELLREKLENLFNLAGGLDCFVKKGDKVLIKPNLLKASRNYLHAITHPNLVYVLCKIIKDQGAYPIVGDNPGTVSLKKFFTLEEYKKITQVAKIAKFEKYIKVEKKMSLFKEFFIAEDLLEIDKIINVAKLKTHAMMLLTLSIKNMFGIISKSERIKQHLKSGRDKEIFAGYLVDVYLLKKPTFNIVDGIIGMEGNGPGSGDPIDIGYLIGGEDGFAVDKVCCELVGVDPYKLYTLKYADRKGIFNIKEPISLKGDVPRLPVVSIKLPVSYLRDYEWGFYFPATLRNFIRELLTEKPVIEVDKCIRCGVCARYCPPAVIDFDKEGPYIDYEKCIRCFCCQEHCPVGAIKVKRGLLSWIKI